MMVEQRVKDIAWFLAYLQGIETSPTASLRLLDASRF